VCRMENSSRHKLLILSNICLNYFQNITEVWLFETQCRCLWQLSCEVQLIYVCSCCWPVCNACTAVCRLRTPGTSFRFQIPAVYRQNATQQKNVNHSSLANVNVENSGLLAQRVLSSRSCVRVRNHLLRHFRLRSAPAVGNGASRG